MPQSSAQSWAGPQGSLSIVSALYPFHNIYGWHLFFSWFYWKGSNTKGSDQPPVNIHHHQTEEPTVECENVSVCSLVLRAQIKALASPYLETLTPGGAV